MAELKPEHQDGVFQLWVLNSNIRYASSGRKGVGSALKVLFRTISRAEAEKLLETPTEATQDISLPQEAIDVVGLALTDSRMLLPAKDRSFKEWRVALLDRWTAEG
jgi:ubiquitin-protein ligase E3 D